MTAVAAKRILDKGVLPYEDWLTQRTSPMHRDPETALTVSGPQCPEVLTRTTAARCDPLLQGLTDDRALGRAGLVQTPHGRAVGRIAGDLRVLGALAQDVGDDLRERVQRLLGLGLGRLDQQRLFDQQREVDRRRVEAV